MAAQATDDVAALKADFAQLREDVAKLTDDLNKAAASGADTARRRAGEESAKLREEVDAAVDQVLDRGSQTLRDAAAEISKRPLTSALVALVIGFLLGRLLDRRD